MIIKVMQRYGIKWHLVKYGAYVIKIFIGVTCLQLK